MKKKLEKKKEEECKIENVNNFSLRLKIEMIIFIISHQIYYTDFYYISSNRDIEHKVNEGL
jgi:competence transcription factor ComK